MTIQMMRQLFATTVGAIFLTACATVDVDRSAASFDEATYANDLSECRGRPALVFAVKGMGSALVGSVYGFVHGVYLGALGGNSAEGAVIGTIVGGAVGLGVGGYDAASEHDRELVQCLRDKGYATEAL